MSLILPLSEMTIREKLEAMELLWDDLAHIQDSVESPAWHGDILNERAAQIASGSTPFIDWEMAKTALRNRAK